jgi:hypothetical protein
MPKFANRPFMGAHNGQVRRPRQERDTLEGAKTGHGGGFRIGEHADSWHEASPVAAIG